eukprot:531148-Pelagomonas_calceolata.AAC.5
MGSSPASEKILGLPCYPPTAPHLTFFAPDCKESAIQSTHQFGLTWGCLFVGTTQRSWTKAALGSSNDAAMSDFAEGHWGTVLAGGIRHEGCRRGRRALRQLAHAQAAAPIWHRIAGCHDSSIEI